jgi:hypothetical protein
MFKYPPKTTDVEKEKGKRGMNGTDRGIKRGRTIMRVKGWNSKE